MHKEEAFCKMKSDRKRIHCILFLVSGVLVFTGCSNKQDKKSKQLKTEIIAENTQNTDREEDLYFDQKVTAEQICDINLNQVGYRPKDKKITVVRDTLYTELGRVAISPFGTVKYQKELMRSQARITEEEYDQRRKQYECLAKQATCYGTNKKKDVSGGWYTKESVAWYVVPSITSLANIMYLEQYYKDEIESLSEEGNIDLDAMIRKEIKWLFKMQDQRSGGVYHKATTKTGNIPNDGNPIVVCEVSTAATADFAAIMAKASMMYEYKDKKLAEDCLKAAEKAWSYLKDNEQNQEFTNPKDMVSWEYEDSSDRDERFWAATELYLATGESEYAKAIREYDILQDDMEFDWSNVSAYACFDFYTKVNKKDSDFYLKIKTKLEGKVKEIQKGCEKGYYINPQYKGSSLHQLLNCAALLALMDKVSPNECYASYVSRYLNYVMGTNAQSRNAFPDMIFEHREQSLEVSSVLLLALQGMKR